MNIGMYHMINDINRNNVSDVSLSVYVVCANNFDIFILYLKYNEYNIKQFKYIYIYTQPRYMLYVICIL